MINLNNIVATGRMTSKRVIFGSMLAVLTCFIGFASQVSAVTLDTSSSQYLGIVVSGEPSSEAAEVIYINNLVDLAPGGTVTIESGGSIGSHTYTRSNNTLCYNLCPDATATGAVSNNTGNNTGIDVTGFEYLLGKYDGPNAGDLVWYVAGLSGTVDILANWGPNPTGTQYGLSHWALFDADGHATPSGTPSVPEPSALILLGSGLLASRIVLKKLGTRNR